MDAFDSELLVDPFEISHVNPDGVIISFGPKNGFLWRGEVANSDDLIGSLKKVFETGFTPCDEQSPLASLPYIQSHSYFICASNTYCIIDEDTGQNEFTGFEHEQTSAGVCGYIYLIDTSKKNIQTIPLCQENLDNPIFVAGYKGEQLSEGPDYAIISQLDSKCIIGAMPSPAVAFALGLKEKSFIKNPAYKEVFYCDKIKGAIGKFSLIELGCFNNFDEACNIQAESKNQQASLGASSSQNRPSVIFFPNSAADNSFSNKEMPESPRP